MTPQKRLYGTYRGVVFSTRDPLGRGRLQVRVPQVFGNGVTGWIPPKQTAGLPTVIPNAGAGVWVEFEGGDPSYPMWSGVFSVQDARVIVLNDLADVTVPTPLDNALLTYDGGTDNWVARNRVEDADYIGITTTPTEAVARADGRIWWDSDSLTLNAGVGTESVLQLGQELQMLVQNDSGAIITHGTLVMGELDGFGRLRTVGQGIIRVVKAVTDGSFPAKLVLGVATEDIANGARGLITEFGYVNSLNTVAPGWALGDLLWNDPAVPGGLTNVEPNAPNLKLPIAVVTRLQTNNGSIYVRMTQGSSLGVTDDNVEFSLPLADGEVLTYDAAAGVWTNAAPGAATLSLDDLTDVDVSGTLLNNQVLAYDGTGTVWLNRSLTASDVGAAAASHTHVAGDLPNLQDLNGTLDVASGGTGATDAATARTNLGAAAASHTHAAGDLPNLQDLNGTLDVASGGTGAVTLTSGGYLKGAGTSAITSQTGVPWADLTGIPAASETASGIIELATSAEVTTGTDTTRAVTPAGLVAGLARSGGMRYVDTVYFTSSGTFSKASYPWLRGIRVLVQGAGGAGGGAAAPGAGNHNAGSGGGGGGCTEAFITDIAGLPSSVTVTVGAGGTAASGAAGNAGGDSSFNSTIIGAGGGGGLTTAASALATSATPGAGGEGSGGDVTYAGTAGGMAGGNATLGIGGSGGGAHLGGGAVGAYTGAGSGGVTGTAGKNYGGGGGGGTANASATARSGGAGAPGIVIVELYA